MKFFTPSRDDSATITLSDGTKVVILPLKKPRGPAVAQDIRNVQRALLKVAGNLDKRMRALERAGR